MEKRVAQGNALFPDLKIYRFPSHEFAILMDGLFFHSKFSLEARVTREDDII